MTHKKRLKNPQIRAKIPDVAKTFDWSSLKPYPTNPGEPPRTFEQVMRVSERMVEDAVVKKRQEEEKLQQEKRETPAT